MAQLQNCCRALQSLARRHTRPAPGGVRCMASASAPLPGSQAQRLVAHILVRDASGAGGAAARLDELEAQLRGGTPFQKLASEASEDRSSSHKGGVLGWLQRGTFYPEFEEAAFGASIGDIVRASTSLGVHLIEVKEERSHWRVLCTCGVWRMQLHCVSPASKRPGAVRDAFQP